MKCFLSIVVLAVAVACETASGSHDDGNTVDVNDAAIVTRTACGFAADPYDQSAVALEQEPPAGFKGKRILLVAGRQSHGPGDHEFFAGTAILMNLLKQTDGVWPIMARDGWPKNEKLFDTADAVLMYMDGGGGHPAIQKPERIELINKQLERGAGWVNLHYAVEYPAKVGSTVQSWLGGYYETGYSVNPHWNAEIRSLPKHEITRGVKPFTLNDEWYFNMRFADELKGITPILQALPPDDKRFTPAAKARKGEIETMAWAFERKGGGRSFGFTGGHFHRNWADEDFRKLVVNAILWSAKIDVPEKGAKVEFDAADLNKNLDKKGKGEFKPILPPERK